MLDAEVLLGDQLFKATLRLANWTTAHCLALLHESGEGRSSPFAQTHLAYRFCDRYTNSSVAIEDGDADLDFCDLHVEVPGRQRLAE